MKPPRDFSIKNFKETLQSGQLFTELFSVVPEISYFVKDRKGRFIDCDDDFCQMMGVQSKEELLGKTDAQLIGADLADNFMKDDLRVMKSGQSLINNLELAPNNDLLPDWRMTTKIPLYDNAENIIGLAGVTRMIRSGDILQGMPIDTNVAIEYITDHFSENINITQIAGKANMSVSTLERRFKNYLGTTPQKYLRTVRVNVACMKIREGGLSMSQIAHSCGFYDQSAMTREFKSRLQVTPMEYARRYRKETCG